MKLIADISIQSADLSALQRCFAAEIPSLQRERSSVMVHTIKDTMHFAVTAEDATALRATLNTITKLLSTFQKAAENNHD